MDYSQINQYVSGLQSSAYSAKADQIKSMAGGLNKDSSYEELEKAAKQFESYLVEQVLKEAKKSIDELKGEDEEDDSYAAQTKDVFMDQTIQTIAASMVDQYGQRFTKELADQMAYNQGIQIPDEAGKTAQTTETTQTG
ncbi:MAG: hypothetical protein IJ679_09635 [Lachnospiraceae bacterium]|nr:hypothetical protein [Lachnospiraceae bacterium]